MIVRYSLARRSSKPREERLLGVATCGQRCTLIGDSGRGSWRKKTPDHCRSKFLTSFRGYLSSIEPVLGARDRGSGVSSISLGQISSRSVRTTPTKLSLCLTVRNPSPRPVENVAQPRSRPLSFTRPLARRALAQPRPLALALAWPTPQEVQEVFLPARRRTKHGVPIGAIYYRQAARPLQTHAALFEARGGFGKTGAHGHVQVRLSGRRRAAGPWLAKHQVGANKRLSWTLGRILLIISSN